MKTIPVSFIEAIPKTDLHLHLDGSLRLSTLIELAKKENIPLPSQTEDGLLETVFKERYTDLPDYLQGFGLTCAVLQNEENLERVSYELAMDNLAENVRYIEVRFAPQLHVGGSRTIEDILRAVNRGLKRAQTEFNSQPEVKEQGGIPFYYGIIACAMRRFVPQMSPYYAALADVQQHAPEKELYAAASLELARTAVQLIQEENLPITGFDLAGEEAGYPAEYHREAYRVAHKNFLKKTVHAGEAYGPESIFQAITTCHANRIGHGTFLFDADKISDPSITDPERYVRELGEYIASERITMEVCPTSNLQTIPSMHSISEHPLRKMLEKNLSVSICTDNRLVSRTTVTRELSLVTEHLPIDRSLFRNIIIAGFKGSFFPGSYNEKRTYVRQVIDRIRQLEHKMLDAV